MTDTEAVLIRKIEERQADLLAVYESVYQALSRVDRSTYGAAALAVLDEALDLPAKIAPAKAIAVLKTILGSTPQDRLPMEKFYGAPFDAVTSVGTYVSRNFNELGLSYHDCWPYLYATGWATRPKDPE